MNWEYWMGIPADGVPLAEHCTGSPTCQCSDCRLTEHNAGEVLKDQLPRGYTYESPEVKANREVGLYTMEEMTSEEYDARQKAYIQQEYPLPADPLLAVSELEQKVNDLVERLRALTVIINGQVDSIELLFEQQNSQNERLNSVESLLSTWTTR